VRRLLARQKTDKIERWTFDEVSGLNASDFVEPSVIHWKSFDGMTISGILYLVWHFVMKGMALPRNPTAIIVSMPR
jgi:dipeptidyl aminopeptidase/acylaminoacyl peptidase